MPTDIADVIKHIHKRLIAAEGQIFGFTQLVQALVASNAVGTVIFREFIEIRARDARITSRAAEELAKETSFQVTRPA